LLLDRKRVKFWQKIIFSFMALLMAGFLLTGILGAFPGCSGGPESIGDRIKQLEAQLKASPGNPQTLLALAEAYQQEGAQEVQGSEQQQAAFAAAAEHYEEYVEALGESTATADKQRRLDALAALAGIYSNLRNYDKLVGVYARVTDLQPNNAENYLYYGQAAQNAGKSDLAVLVYRKFLELAPDSPYAKDVKELLDELTGKASPSPSSGGSQ
jgi:tetratricopeptide (TPR) repeat protein